jgi:uncharacterized peroxidase-related enzyme
MSGASDGGELGMIHNPKESAVPLVPPLRREDLATHEPTFQAIEAALGVLPNSTLTMARWPELMEAFAALNAVVMADGAVDGPLKQMVAAVVSAAAGCSYCQAHTSHVGALRGADPRKLEHLWEYESSELFDEPERAALRVAQAAGLSPNAVTDADVEALRAHFDERQIVELVAVIANFGFLNRWNDTMATELERSPLTWATDHLSDGGWAAGKHGAGRADAEPAG